MRRWLFAFLVITSWTLSASPMEAGTFRVASDAAQVRLILELRAQQFLNRATFGATNAEISALADSMATLGIKAACEKWIDDQFAIAPTLHVNTMKSFMATDGITTYNDATKNLLRYRYHAFWHNAITSPDQLKQRLAWALIQICVVGEGGDNFNFVEFPTQAPDKPYWFAMSSYYDTLLSNCDKRYFDVLKGATYHPAMGVWLSSIRNAKGNGTTTFPDENYAREIMQLFTIGLNELNLDGTFKLDAQGEVIPTYDNEIIGEFAKVFTGFNYANGTTTSFGGYTNYVDPMAMVQSQHHTGQKTLFPDPSTGQPRVLPANQPGNTDIQQALENLYSHANVAPFISRLLIQRFVRSNPSKGYIQRVSTAFNGSGPSTKGDMKAVMKAILTDDEAWTSIRITRLRSPLRIVVSSSGTEFGRLIEPVVQYASFVRRYGAPPTTAPAGSATATYVTPGKYYFGATPGTWNQAPFRSPSVFNFYLPHHQPAGWLATTPGSSNIPNGDLVAPEFQIVTAVVANAWQNRSRSDVVNSYIDQGLFSTTTNGTTVSTNVRIPFDFAFERSIAMDAATLVEHLDKVLCNGVMSDDVRSRLTNALTTQTAIRTNTQANQDADILARVRGALITTLNLPPYLIRY
jgi:uncharacterized protein (DUF1800 family)